MTRLIALALTLLLIAAAPPRVGPPMDCTQRCEPTDFEGVHPERGEVVLKRMVLIDADALPLDRPLAIRVEALASSEISWNGKVIARNGVPGASRSEETPGRLATTVIVPADLLRPGWNEARVRLSAHHLWLSVGRPVHIFEIGPYSTPELGRIIHYLPALLSLGALLASGAYFAMAAANVPNRRSILLAGIASLTALQLSAEVVRAFVNFSYPWALGRVAAIALLSAATAILIAAFASERFLPRHRTAPVAATALVCAGFLLFAGPFDVKAVGSLLTGVAALAIAALVCRGPAPARRMAVAWSLTAVALILADLSLFLDYIWFALVACGLALLVAEQVLSLKRAQMERDAASARAEAFAQRLARAERDGEPILQLKDGGRHWRVAQEDVVLIKAVDDYCEVTLVDGRRLLVTAGLSRLLAELPERFVRVHKSWAVNRTHVLADSARSGGGRLLTLSNGDSVPVGRAFAANWANSVLVERKQQPISAG